MDQEKFVSSYIELLTATVTESVQKNIVLQTQKKIAEYELNEIKEALKVFEDKSKEALTLKQNQIDSLNHQLFILRQEENIKIAETVELKKEKDHLETFKNELIKSRKHNENLVLKINSLELAVEEKTKIIENLTTEIAKTLKSEVEKKAVKKNAEQKILAIEDAGNF